jgi:uncharacterized protein with HEPN domain
MRGDRYRLLDILEAIDNIKRRVGEGREAFPRDGLIRVWVVHHMRVIGEAAAVLSAPLREQHSAVPWRDVTAMRNVLVHQHFGIDIDGVGGTAMTDLPVLRQNVQALLGELQQETGGQNSPGPKRLGSTRFRRRHTELQQYHADPEMSMLSPDCAGRCVVSEMARMPKDPALAGSGQDGH